MRCINCGVATQRLRRHMASSLPDLLLNILARWLTIEAVNYTCHPCWMRHQRELNQDQNRSNTPGSKPRPDAAHRPVEPGSEPLPNDMENYIRYKVMGSVSKIRMKQDCVPTKFECQPNRVKRPSNDIKRPYILKRRRKMLVEQSIQDLEEKCRNVIEDKEPVDTSEHAVLLTMKDLQPSSTSFGHTSDRDSLEKAYILEAEQLDTSESTSPDPSSNEYPGTELKTDLELYADSGVIEKQNIEESRTERRREIWSLCNVCASEMKGFRFTCLQCAAWDMCVSCAARGEHPEHYVLRVPEPRSNIDHSQVIAAVKKHIEDLLNLTKQITRTEDDNGESQTIKEEVTDMNENASLYAPGGTSDLDPLRFFIKSELREDVATDSLHHKSIEHPVPSEVNTVFMDNGKRSEVNIVTETPVQRSVNTESAFDFKYFIVGDGSDVVKTEPE